MFFDERPKERREDLFDREEEVEAIKGGIGRPMIVLTGIRRIGKTSVLKVALNEIDRPVVLIDARSLGEEYSRRVLYACVAEGLKSSLDALKEVLSRVRGVRIAGMEIELSWKGREALSLAQLFDALDKKGAVIAVDEAQRLRGPLSTEFVEAVAHAYDYAENLTFIFTGSEVGLLYDFLGVEDPESPLYGRYFLEVKLERFTREQSLEFLKEGFKQAGKKPPLPLEEVVDALNGIPGWLTFFGCRCLEGKCDVGEVLRLAVKLAKAELEKLLRNRSRRCRLVLRAIAEGARNWSSVMRYVEEKEGRTVSKSVLYNAIKALEDMSIIRNYRFLDPVYREAAKLLR